MPKLARAPLAFETANAGHARCDRLAAPTLKRTERRQRPRVRVDVSEDATTRSAVLGERHLHCEAGRQQHLGSNTRLD